MPARPYGLFDPIRGNLGVFVLPNPNRDPAARTKNCIGLGITESVSFDLLIPEGRVADWQRAVVGAPMPEAAVNENRNLGPRKHDVCFSA